MGNSSLNPNANEIEKKEYNRVRIKEISAGTFIHWKGDLDAKIKIGVNIQNYQIENTTGRFINQELNPLDPVFKGQKFINTEASYQFENADNPVFTTMGIKTELKVGYTSNLKNDNNFAYLIPAISFDHKLFHSDKLVFATKIKGHFNYGDSYEFYQAATIGGNKNGLRGYRNQRFTGKNSF